MDRNKFILFCFVFYCLFVLFDCYYFFFDGLPDSFSWETRLERQLSNLVSSNPLERRRLGSVCLRA